MPSITCSRLVDVVDDPKLALSRWFGRPDNGTGTKRPLAPYLSRKRDIFVAFVVVSLPLLVIAILLLVFVFARGRENPGLYVESPTLPFLDSASQDAYYTQVDSGDFLLIGSWASTIAEFVVAPFMVLFSYAVAREVLNATRDHEDGSSRPPLLREIMRGAHVGVWHWVTQKAYKKSQSERGRLPVLSVVDVAGLGLLTATLLTIMVIVGDNWLHAATESVSIRHFDDPTNYMENESKYSSANDDPYSAGFSPIANCTEQLNAPLSQNGSTASPPCSLNDTGNFTNVVYPWQVYLTLDTGISQVSSDFNGINYTNVGDEESRQIATPYQVVTYLKEGVSHSLLFIPDAAAEYDNTLYGYGTHYGVDYVANSVSMVTQCTFVTGECGVHGSTTNTSDVNNISIPFHCYDDFSGNLGQTPATGHERAQGWNMSFYKLVNGKPTTIPIQAASNPFHFYAATAVNSIDLQDFDSDSNLTEGDPQNGSLVNVGNGFTAFALSCEATIYDVTFSIINGSFQDFNTSISSPQKANIVQAPLQVGFGQYHLYQAASTAVLAINYSVALSMGKAFSQTGMALASGAFAFDYNIEQRFRWTVNVARVPKAPFFYLVAVCLIYSAFGIVMTVLALHLRRIPELRDQQAKLMVEWAPELLERDSHREEDEREERRRGDDDVDIREGRRSSVSLDS